MSSSSRWPNALAWAVWGGLLVAAPAAWGATKDAAVATSGDADLAEVLRRLRELEAKVGTLRAESAKLRAELAERGAEVPNPGADAMMVEPNPAAGLEASDWDEPEVVKAPEGRDEEARRRLTEVETQVRKVVAAATKEEEEKRQKVQFEFSGAYKVRGNNRNNFDLGNPLQSWQFDSATFVDHRFQLGVDASYEAFHARLLLDKGNFTFDWKEDSEGTLERWGGFESVTSALVRELFVEYTGTAVFRVGRQVWDLGHELVHSGPADGAQIQYPMGRLPWGHTTLTGSYWAVAGGWSSFDEFRQSGGPPAGNRQAVLGARNELDAFHLEADIRPLRGVSIRPYAVAIQDRGGRGSADLNLDKDFDATTMPRDGHFEPLWAGAAISADLSGWKFDAEGVLLTGSLARTRDVEADALVLGVQRHFDTFDSLGDLWAGLEAGRGSGNEIDDPADGTLRDFNGLFLCRDRHKYGNIFSEDIRAGYFFWDSNLSNITYLRLHAALEPIPGLHLAPSVSRMWTTEPVFQGRGPVGDWSRGTATSTATTRDVGWEVDLNASYPILKHLEAFAALGYFQPGAVYARSNGSNPDPAIELVLGAEFRF